MLNARSINAAVKAVTRPDAKASGGGEASSTKPAGQGASPPAPSGASKPVQRSDAEARYFAAAKSATDIAAATGLADRAKAAAKVGAATASTYAQVYERRMRRAPASGVTAEDLLRGVSRASWHSTRAAIMHHLAKEAAAAKAKQEAAFKAGNVPAATAWAQERLAIATIARDAMALDAPTERRKRLTKKETVPSDPDWRARVFEAATKAQKPGVAVLWATGCRPAEIATGVDVSSFEKDGKTFIRIDIPGAKVGEHSGQPQRHIIIDAASDPGSALLSVLGTAKRMTITRNADVLNNDFSRIRKRLRKTGGADWQVAPYSMRHQMSADAKVHFAEILNEDEAMDAVATLLGHRVTRSQGRYGHPSQAKGGTGLVSVTATHAIKPTHSDKPSRARAAPRPRSDP